MNEQGKNWLILLLYIVLIVFIGFLPTVLHSILPTSAEATNFFANEWWAVVPYATDTDYNWEHQHAYYLRRHTASLGGNIFDSTFYPMMFVYTPFHYYNYIDKYTEEMHVYVSVNTRDAGVLIFNPVNGKYIGTLAEVETKSISIDELMDRAEKDKK